MNQRIQIYIPFYKGIDHLQESIKSVLAQTCSQWDLTVVDDCGPDGAKASEFVANLNDSRVHYVRNKENIGMSANWNYCFDIAKQSNASFVTLLHDDDMLLPNYVQTMLSAYSKNPEAALISCGSRIISESGDAVFSMPDFVKRFLRPSKIDFRLKGEAAYVALLRGNFIMCPTVCYNIARIGELRFQTNLKQVQDLEFYFRVLEKGEQLLVLSEIAYAYRRHSGAATSIQTATLLRFKEENALYNSWNGKFQSLNFNDASRVAMAKTIIKLNLGFCFVMDVVRFRFRAAFQKLSFFNHL